MRRFTCYHGGFVRKSWWFPLCPNMFLPLFCIFPPPPFMSGVHVERLILTPEAGLERTLFVLFVFHLSTTGMSQKVPSHSFGCHSLGFNNKYFIRVPPQHCLNCTYPLVRTKHPVMTQSNNHYGSLSTSVEMRNWQSKLRNVPQ